jgi:two-component system NtrC family sensor kinase
VQDSAQRISRVIARLQRFVSLYEAEPQQANVNELIAGVVTLYEDQLGGDITFEVDLQPVPDITCRPELLSAVFSNLLSNAINAVDGNGSVGVSTREVEGSVEIAVMDNGRGMPADMLDNVFDPGFTVSETRVSTGNWSLFNSRQVLYQHGGDIRIESSEGRGTTVTVSLPLPSESAR